MDVPQRTARARVAKILDLASIGIGMVLLVAAICLLFVVTSRGRDVLDVSVAIMATLASAGIVLRGVIGRRLGNA